MGSASEKDSMVRMYNFETEDNYVLPVRGIVCGERAGETTWKPAYCSPSPRRTVGRQVVVWGNCAACE